MRSKINLLADYRKAPLEKEIKIQCPEEYLQRQMRHLTRTFKKTEPVTGALQAGDVTVLALESDVEKFNRPAVFVTLGGGLFDRDFEEKVVGHGVGETFETEAAGRPVKVTVKQATRTIFPEPTDDMAEAYARDHEDFAGVKTVAEYRMLAAEKYREEQKQNVIYDAMDQVIEYVLTHSDFDFDEEEVADSIKEADREIRVFLEEEGKALEALSEDELKGFFGVSSLAELEVSNQINAERYIGQELWLESIHGVDAIEKLEDPWGFLEEFVRDTLRIEEVK